MPPQTTNERQRRKIVEELNDIATKLKANRDQPQKTQHAIENFNRACAKAGRLVILAVEQGFLPEVLHLGETLNLSKSKPSTDQQFSNFWTVFVAPWLRSVAGPAFVGAGNGKRDFDFIYRRGLDGKLIDAAGKPLKSVIPGKAPRTAKWEDLEHLEGSDWEFEDDYDDADKLHHIRQRMDDLIHDAETLAGLIDPPGSGSERAETETPKPAIDDDARLGPGKLAELFGVGSGALQKRLERWRADNPNESGKGWIEVPDRKPREPQYLYRVGSVRPIIDAMKASSERRAKKK
jgi:hypothetical protein